MKYYIKPEKIKLYTLILIFFFQITNIKTILDIIEYFFKLKVGNISINNFFVLLTFVLITAFINYKHLYLNHTKIIEKYDKGTMRLKKKGEITYVIYFAISFIIFVFIDSKL